MFPDPQPIIPYGEQDPATALWTESGFRAVRGIVTEGRYLVFQGTGAHNLGLAASGSGSDSNGQPQADTHGHTQLSSSPVPSQKESDPNIRFIIHEQGIFPDLKYLIQAASLPASSSYLDSDLQFTSPSSAAAFSITYNAEGTSYTIQVASSQKYISVNERGQVSLSSEPFEFTIFSVTWS
jgi:phospholipase C